MNKQIKASFDNSKAAVGLVLKNLSTLQSVFGKAQRYFLAKTEPKTRALPLFATLDEPCVRQVGHLVKFTCGHNGKPSDGETNNLTLHLDYAGFLSPSVAIRESPRRYSYKAKVSTWRSPSPRVKPVIE